MDKIAVLIPCYNEGQTIAKVVKDYREALPEATIYVYDNNSSDHTDEIAREAGAVVRYEYQQGKGNVIRSMFRDIDAQCYLMIDGDDTYPAENAREMVNLVLERKVDMVVAHAQFFTSAARYADIILPLTTEWERFDGLFGGTLGHKSNREMMVAYQQIIDPLYEAKSDQDIACELAEKLGIARADVYPFDVKQQYFNQLASMEVCDEDGKTYVPAVGITQEDIDELTAAGQLFAPDAYADHAFDFKNRSNVVKALCLHVAHTCNLNCSYCFAAQGKFHGEAGLMSFETGKRALDFLIENSGTRRNLEVDFFGGEPLMNFEVCKQLVAYARSIEKKYNKNFRFTMTTNGIGITDEVIDWCNKECHNVVLSLDGRKEVNDRFRVDLAGNGSYDRIVPKFQKLVKARGGQGYYMRGTFTHHNVDFTKDLFHMADDLGFTELSMEPVVAPPDSPEALTEEDLPKLFDQYELLANDMLRRQKAGKPITFYHYILDLKHGPCIYKRISGCGSGTEYMAVTPWGDLYPCHQFVGDPKYLMGDIWKGVTNTAVRDEFKHCNAYARKECQNCWAKLYCSGGCAANSYHATGNITGVYEYGCELFKKRMECAIMIKVAENQELAAKGIEVPIELGSTCNACADGEACE